MLATTSKATTDTADADSATSDVAYAVDAILDHRAAPDGRLENLAVSEDCDAVAAHRRAFLTSLARSCAHNSAMSSSFSGVVKSKHWFMPSRAINSAIAFWVMEWL